MKKFLPLVFGCTIIVSFFLLRELSSITEFEAKESATELMKRYSNVCGGGFENTVVQNLQNPPRYPGIDADGYTFESNNGKCTMTIYI